MTVVWVNRGICFFNEGFSLLSSLSLSFVFISFQNSIEGKRVWSMLWKFRCCCYFISNDRTMVSSLFVYKSHSGQNPAKTARARNCQTKRETFNPNWFLFAAISFVACTASELNTSIDYAVFSSYAAGYLRRPYRAADNRVNTAQSETLFLGSFEC